MMYAAPAGAKIFAAVSAAERQVCAAPAGAKSLLL